MVMERLDERIGARPALIAGLPCLSRRVLAQLLMVMERLNKRVRKRPTLQPGVLVSKSAARRGIPVMRYVPWCAIACGVTCLCRLKYVRWARSAGSFTQLP